MKEQIAQLSEDPAALEALYRHSREHGQEVPFAAAIEQCSAEAPDNVLLRAWAYRLRPDSGSAGDLLADGSDAGRARHWITALAVSVVSGVLFAVFAGDRPPVPIPNQSNPLFWIGWGPLTALAVVAFIGLGTPTRSRLRWHVGAAAAAIVLGLTGAAVAWGRTDDVATLVALHLPFLAWAAIGAAVTLGRDDRARHGYAYAVQSLEVLVAGGIFLGSGMIFGALTLGLLAVFAIEIPQGVLRAAAGFGIGAIAVLAVASVYDPARSPAQQRPTGVARILRIMTWLLLPAALAVLALYVLWFIPAHFWRAFEERSVLIVYNVTIIAILVSLVAAASAAAIGRARSAERILRPAAISLITLTLLLNVYALAAILFRALEYGLSPNRHAVLGWNIVTLLMLAFLGQKSWSAERGDWLPTFHESLGRVSVLPVLCAVWVVLVVPLL